MKIPMMNNIMSSIIESPITETTKSLDDRLKENGKATNYHDSCTVNKNWRRSFSIVNYVNYMKKLKKAKRKDYKW